MHEQLTEWWNGISLRGKITGVTVMLLTLGLLVAGVGTMSLLRSYLLNQVYSNNLTVYASSASDTVVDTCRPGVKVAPKYYFAVINQSGTVICSAGPDDATIPIISRSTLPKVIHTGVAFTLSDKHSVDHWQAVGYPVVGTTGSAQNVLIIAYNLGENDQIIGQFALIFLFFALIVVVLGGALTRILVGSTFSPLKEVEQTAARFAAGDFSQRLERA
ncbi:MAG TPA: sensor histidine kinase, partial [Galbitalea sp.]